MAIIPPAHAGQARSNRRFDPAAVDAKGELTDITQSLDALSVAVLSNEARPSAVEISTQLQRLQKRIQVILDQEAAGTILLGKAAVVPSDVDLPDQGLMDRE